jgi:hypothetical protein
MHSSGPSRPGTEPTPLPRLEWSPLLILRSPRRVLGWILHHLMIAVRHGHNACRAISAFSRRRGDAVDGLAFTSGSATAWL